MGVLDMSIVITALTKIHTTLGFSNTALSWVQNAYLLAFGGLPLLGARASVNKPGAGARGTDTFPFRMYPGRNRAHAGRT